MTEVDAVMPEGVATLSIPSETTTKPTNSASPKSVMEASPKKDKKCHEISEALPKAMEVDGADTEEDESQVTSSSENGVTTGAGGDDSKMSAQTPITSAENSKESEEENESSEAMLKTNTISENSSNACDGVSQNLFSKQTSDKSEDSVPNVENSLNSKDCDNSLSNAKPERTNKSNEDTNDNLNQDESSISKVSTKEDSTKSINAANDGCEPMATTGIVSESEDPLAHPVLQKENGVASVVEKKLQSDTGVVDLDDDSDDDECTSTAAVKTKHAELTPNGNNAKEADGISKISHSVCSDSDGAVVIGSDSENEAPETPMNTSTKTAGHKTETQIIDDDDDDCVVIEDDTPASTINDLTKRKSLAMDPANNSDDSQPPSKRQRNTQQPGAVSQITIKDARSLMPQDATTKKPSDMVGVYPINITPAPAPVLMQGPPKLVPMGSATNMPIPGLPGLSSSSNLLPGLTDDMFVLEAPSFIVPYIYEKPPADNLKEIVREIGDKYKFTKEDLADADKSDEFDMMTEQNKQEEKSGKKKKKRRGGDDPDDSWSEESEEDDDDDEDDSEAEVRTKVLIKEVSDDLSALKVAIKPAAAVVQPSESNNTTPAKPGQENYFESPLGKFFMDIGVGLVQEFVQSDLIRLQKRKMRKSLGKNITEFERAIAALSGNVEASKKKNAAFKFTMKRCEFCNFKSESALAMANHYETPHMNGQLYKCNFCTFEIRSATEIVYHMEAMHNIKARLVKPLPYHQCPNCGFEDNGKAKLSRHQPVCAKKFRPELNLSPPTDWEAPAKIPRIKPRHGLVGTATAYQAMAAQAAAQKAALASIQQQQQQVAQARSLQAAAIAAQNAANKIRGRPPTMTQKGPNGNAMLRGPNQVRNPMATNVVLPNNYQLPSGQLIQQTANALAKKTLSGQPSISITPLPRQSASPQTTSPSTSKLPPAGMKPGQNVTAGNKAQFVICEICDGYIKDLEQLRNHMQWMHKVKIHPKMIYNRPPLNCQKCQFRFFTDQGLERHLLGSHGLVTSSMQEAANKGKDAGRCPVCGRMYQWKLLNHVSRDHHMTLKPAHLSYKCTVCTATFGMYKQFETHVYTAHSTVAKKAMDGKKNNAASGIGAPMGSSSSQRSSLSATNDSLLKPLKINDEITIIPQPASKPRITNMESHVID